MQSHLLYYDKAAAKFVCIRRGPGGENFTLYKTEDPDKKRGTRIRAKTDLPFAFQGAWFDSVAAAEKGLSAYARKNGWRYTSGPEKTPYFVHDCDSCIYLRSTSWGEHGEHCCADYYLCKGSGDNSVLVRYSDNAPDYTSSPVRFLSVFNSHLLAAAITAVQQGLLPFEEIKLVY